MSHNFTNHLIHETSPYLLQHAHNPVDWYPWGNSAIERSQKEDKPIFLSIGYSSCHWCHVMEHESFEDEEISRIMNSEFVNIKVDREERPDIDSIYMDFVQMTTGSGGWPLSVFLTPDLVPFFGGTYFPPVSLYGRPGFKDVLDRVAGFYREKKHDINQNREKILSGLQNRIPSGNSIRGLKEELIQEAANQLIRMADREYGGFGNAPKFPSSMALSFLLRNFHRNRDSASLEIVTRSLDQMANGGIYDHLGGGFHRYSTDETWLVPHFEKMLYDNALLTMTYLEAYQTTQNPHYREIVEETLQYIQREMTHSQGGFYSAEDADSEGVEGKYYVWDRSEVTEILGRDSAGIFCDHFDVSENGNWEGHNILHRRRDLKAQAEELGWDASRLKKDLNSARRKLLQHRNHRVRPGLDDKILASWNGLMLSAFADAAFVLQDGSFLTVAVNNAEFLAAELIQEDQIQRTWKNGTAKIAGFLDDYAFAVQGFLKLFQVNGDFKWLDLAQNLTESQIDLFWDPSRGDFYLSSEHHDNLLLRQKEYYDNAIPSGNSTTAGNLMQLAILTGEEKYQKISERLLTSLADSSVRHPLAFSNWLSMIDFSIGPVYEIVVLGGEKAEFQNSVAERFIPNKITLFPDSIPAGEKQLPLLQGREIPERGTVAYLCKEFVCLEPADDPETFRDQLKKELSSKPPE